MFYSHIIRVVATMDNLMPFGKATITPPILQSHCRCRLIFSVLSDKAHLLVDDELPANGIEGRTNSDTNDNTYK